MYIHIYYNYVDFNILNHITTLLWVSMTVFTVLLHWKATPHARNKTFLPVTSYRHKAGSHTCLFLSLWCDPTEE